ncbi:MAG: serine hydrolase domain-containing protein [Sandaracinaceae bacterium]
MDIHREAPPGAGASAPGWAAVRFDASGPREVWVDGHARLDEARPVTPETRFRWFSITKLLTATLVMRAAERGLLSLDDRLADHALSPTPSPTLRQLLSHAGGIAVPSPIRWAHPPGARRRDGVTLKRELLSRQPNAEGIGRARYTNLGYLLHARVLEGVEGAPFEDGARALLDALSLEETGFSPRDAALGHEKLASLRSAVMSVLFLPRTPRLIAYAERGWIGLVPYEIEGAAYGGLVGSILDLTRFGQVFLRDGDGVLRPESVREMLEPHGTGPEGTFGLGFWHDGAWRGHGGWAGGYRSELWIEPERGVGVAALANAGDATLARVVDRLKSV